MDQMRAVLGSDGTLRCGLDWYGVTEVGNFEGRNYPFNRMACPRSSLLRPPHYRSGAAADAGGSGPSGCGPVWTTRC